MADIKATGKITNFTDVYEVDDKDIKREVEKNLPSDMSLERLTISDASELLFGEDEDNVYDVILGQLYEGLHHYRINLDMSQSHSSQWYPDIHFDIISSFSITNSTNLKKVLSCYKYTAIPFYGEDTQSGIKISGNMRPVYTNQNELSRLDFLYITTEGNVISESLDAQDLSDYELFVTQLGW